jgi:hypothetical protein
MDWLARRNRRPRTLRSFLLRIVVPRLVGFLGVAAMFGLGQAMAVSPSAHSSVLPPERAVQVAPAWTAADAQDFPGCRPAAAWPSGTPAAYLVVHSYRQGRHVKMAFDVAWQANHDDTEANDVWVIGVCGRP